MIQASLLDQIKTFFNILVNTKTLWIIVIMVLGLVLLLTLASKFHNKKITKVLYAIVYLGIFGTLIYFFHEEIFELFDYLIDNIFLFLFFPNLAVYILVLVVVNVIIIKSTFSEKDNKIIKVFNIIAFIVFDIIFYLIIDNVIKNDVNVYEQLSIYTNNDLLILIELSMKLFVVWLLVLIIIKITRSLINGISLSKATNNLVVTENNDDLKFQNLEVMEINPVQEIPKIIPEYHNEMNDYVDIMPIKKQMQKLTDDFKIQEVMTPKIEQLEDDDVEPKETPLTEIVAESNPFDNIVIKDTHDTLVIANQEKIEPKILLSSYDSIFKDENRELETSIDNNMKIVFDDNNYLKNILSDIEDLRNNVRDETKIKKIYDEVKIRENELTLNDYNFLINELITIKK